MIIITYLQYFTIVRLLIIFLRFWNGYTFPGLRLTGQLTALRPDVSVYHWLQYLATVTLFHIFPIFPNGYTLQSHGMIGHLTA